MVESKAIAKYVRMTPRKVRRVADLVRGKKAGEAMLSLRFMPYRAAKTIEKLLKSAMSNAAHKADTVDAEQMTISKLFVDDGPSMKRMMPRAMGRANIIRKRTSHITLQLSSGADE